MNNYQLFGMLAFSFVLFFIGASVLLYCAIKENCTATRQMSACLETSNYLKFLAESKTETSRKILIIFEKQGINFASLKKAVDVALQISPCDQEWIENSIYLRRLLLMYKDFNWEDEF